MEARAKASSGSTALTLLDLRKASKNEAPVSDVLQKIGFYRDKWRGRRWSMAKQLKMAKTGAYRGPPPRVADVQILQTGAPWPNLAMRTQPNLPIAQLQRTRSVSPNGGRGAAAAAASSSNGASSKGKGGKTGGGKQGGGKTGGGKQGGGKQSGGGDAPPGAAGEPLSSTSTELLAQGEKFVVEADGAATEAEAVLVNSFERVAGAALIAKVGSAGKVDEVMKEWDQNKDGALSMGEWRKSLRASLGIKASNEELDRVFSSVDGDKSGSVDLSELRQLLRNMRAEAELAGTESQKLRSRAASLRSKAAKAREVAELTRAYEEMDLKLKLARESVPLASRLGEMLVRRQIKIGDLVAKWDKDGNGELSKEELRQNIVELGVVVREQHLPELSTMYEGLDLDGNGQLSLPELKKMLKSLAEAALGNTDVTKKLAKEVAAAKRVAKNAQNDFEVELGTAGLQSNKGDYGESDDIVVGAT